MAVKTLDSLLSSILKAETLRLPIITHLLLIKLRHEDCFESSITPLI